MGKCIKTEENTIRIIPFKGGKLKRCMWSGNLTERAEIRGCDTLIKGNLKIPPDDAHKKIYGGHIYVLNINKMSYN